MSRVKENQEVINALYEQTTNADAESTEEVVCLYMGVLAAILTDISKSLAVIADKAESEEE